MLQELEDVVGTFYRKSFHSFHQLVGRTVTESMKYIQAKRYSHITCFFLLKAFFSKRQIINKQFLKIYCQPFCLFYFRALFVSSCWPRQGLGTRESNIELLAAPGLGHERERVQYRVVGCARAWARESPI